MESLPAVLIVDDDRVVLHTMQDQLSRENYRVAAISSVAEALQRLRIERFGIIIADQFMPETPGLEFLRICRETQPLSSRMIITGMASTADIEVVKDLTRALKLSPVFDDMDKRSLLARLVKARLTAPPQPAVTSSV